MNDKIKALGFDDETSKKIEEVLKEIIKDAYVPLSRFNEVNDAKKKLDETVAERDKQLSELSNATGMTDELKKQIEQLQASNVEARKNYDAEIKRIKTETYIDDRLLESGVIDKKFIPAIKAYLPNVDIDSDDSKIVFDSKISEVKAFLPTMFKTNEPDVVKTKGFHPGESGGEPMKKDVDSSRWEDFLNSYQQN